MRPAAAAARSRRSRPGAVRRKLAASIYYQGSDAKGARKVTGRGGSVSYRLNRGLTLFAYASHSKTDEIGFLVTETTSGRLGLRVNF